jgi:ketosteroid isomerase-like protein
MTVFRRDVVFAAGAMGLTSISPAVAASPASRDLDAEVAELVEISAKANAALVRGDVRTYRTLVVPSDDFTLMSPFGGRPSRAEDITEQTWAEIADYFRDGDFEQKVVQTYASSDMIVLVVTEHIEGEVGGLPRQKWQLRVTLVYRRVGTDWLLAHRHADPLVEDLPLAELAVLARR